MIPTNIEKRLVENLMLETKEIKIGLKSNGISHINKSGNDEIIKGVLSVCIDSCGKILSLDIKNKQICILEAEEYIGLTLHELYDKDEIFVYLKNILTNSNPQDFYYRNAYNLSFLKSKHDPYQTGNFLSFINVIQIQKSYSTNNKDISSKIPYYLKVLYEKSPYAILVLNESDKIIDCNNSFVSLFQFSPEEILGFKGEELLYPGKQENPDSILDKFKENKKTQKETIRKKKDGSLIHVFLQSDKISIDENITGRYIMYSDISSRKRSEEQIISSLLEKEVLLKEIHHRVKNNLQIISSMLNFQLAYIKDEESIQMFKDSQNRIKSIALLHEKLYQASDLSRIDFANYIRSLTTYLFNSTGLNRNKVTFNIKSENIFLSIDNAIPCGLIVNELITNSLKYAFPDDRKGEILIQIQYHQNNKFTLIVKDDGIGFPKNKDFRTSESLGLKLVMILINQMGASIELDNNNGTEFKIEFSILNYIDRI